MKITFEPASVKHAEVFLDYRRDPITRKHNPPKPATLEDVRARLETSESDWRKFATANEFFWFAARGTEIVGTATLAVNRMMLTAEVGYGVFKNARGQGVGSAIVRELTDQAFRQSPLRKLIAMVHAENHASIRLLEKAGYVREGLLKEHYLIDGQPVNELIYGLLRADRLSAVSSHNQRSLQSVSRAKSVL